MTSARPVVAPRWRGKLTPDQRVELLGCSHDFRMFTRHWHFVDEAGEDRILGEQLWESQIGLIEVMERSPFVAHLKARRLGSSTVATAFDAWILRFGPRNARVHIFSRTESDAQEILRGRDGTGGLLYGLQHLPDFMQLPMRSRTSDIVLDAGKGDVRVAVAYASDADVSVGTAARHLHIDELARMQFAERLWAAAEPTVSAPGCSAHLLSTGLGPSNWWGEFWQRARSGDTKTRFECYFSPATARAGRDAAWLAELEADPTLSEVQRRNEYAQSEEDALYGGGSYWFERSDLDRACRGTGRETAEAEHKYRLGWDLAAEGADASVGVVVDVTRVPYQVVKYTRLQGVKAPGVQSHIEADWDEFGGAGTSITIENNGLGSTLISNLAWSEPRADAARYNTTQRNKEANLSNLAAMFEHGSLRYDRVQWPQLDRELRAAARTGHVPDSVMALCLALHDVTPSAGRDQSRGRLRGIIRWGGGTDPEPVRGQAALRRLREAR